MGECPIGYQIDRMDNTKGYYKENCRWVDPKTNMSNRSISKIWIVNGKEYKIERGRKPNVLKFYVNHEEQAATDEAQGDSRETQDEIEKIQEDYNRNKDKVIDMLWQPSYASWKIIVSYVIKNKLWVLDF